MKGYKVFNPDWTCRGYQYEVGNTYEMDKKPKICERGFHFCEKPVDCFKFYDFNPLNKVAEVEAIGDLDTDGTKTCTNKILILREISWNEVLTLVNVGKNCTGFCNTGNRNTGDWNTGNWNTGDCNTGDCNTGNKNTGNRNTGDWNTGNRNTGDWNTGDCNTGNCNTGNCNTGDWNTGDCNTGNRNTGNCNTGDCNTGNRNTGDWNTGDCNNTNFSNGCFNTIEPKILMFNKPSDWTYRDWLQSDARCLLNRITRDVVEWIDLDDMTDEEKILHPEAKTTDGYLKVLNESENAQIWWDCLNDEQKLIILSLPNFDKDIFEQCVGVKI